MKVRLYYSFLTFALDDVWSVPPTGRFITGERVPGTQWYDVIYLLTATGLSPGGSSTVHTYTQTIDGTAQITTNLEECGPCPVFACFILAFTLQLGKKHCNSGRSREEGGVRADLGALQKRKVSRCFWELNEDSLVYQPVAQSLHKILFAFIISPIQATRPTRYSSRGLCDHFTISVQQVVLKDFELVETSFCSCVTRTSISFITKVCTKY